jgi:hypothetical protein
MKFQDLSMVNLHARDDGAWSYTVYTKPHGVWRTNRGLGDPVECWDEILREMLDDEAVKIASAANAAAAEVRPAQRRPKASGGSAERNADVKTPARGRGATAKASGPTRAAPPRLPAKVRRQASGKGR